MSYTVLARRYRSATFDQVVGQEHVAQTLKKAIASNRVAHAYLFCGTRGTGKTSMARILAKALNCQKAPGPTATPCGQCDSCQAIARGDDIDVIEIDAASNTGVDNVREIIANSQYRPARARFKVYIIDEAHMLSKSAFNALLKTLEEPPSHVKFILATTEPEKLPATILSRCQRYDFRNISTALIAQHLKEICRQEKIEVQDDALAMVARWGAGSMRDALSLLDRLLSADQTPLDVGAVERVLGLPRIQLVYDLVESFGAGDAAGALRQADAIVRAGLSVDSLIVALGEHMRNLLVARTCGSDSELLDSPGITPKQLLEQARKFDPATLSQDIAILDELRRNLRYSAMGPALLDATLTRLALAEQFASIGQLLSNPGKPIPAASVPPPQAPPPVQKKKPEPPSQPIEPPAAIAPATSDMSQIWKGLLGALGQQGSFLPGALSLANLVHIDDEKAVIRFSRAGETFATTFETNGKREVIAQALSELRGRPVGVKFEVEPEPLSELPGTATATAAPPPAPARDASPVPAPPPRSPPINTEALKEDPIVQAILREFGATIVKVD